MNNEDVRTQSQESDQDGQQTAPDATLEEFLAAPAHKGAYDAAVSAAVEQALADQKAALEEEKRVASLPEQERADEREKALAAREAKLAAAELKSEAIKKLAAAGMFPELAECLSYESRESYEQSYTAATTAFEKAVQDAINDRLRGNTLPITQSEHTGRTAGTTGGFAEIIKENQARR